MFPIYLSIKDIKYCNIMGHCIISFQCLIIADSNLYFEICCTFYILFLVIQSWSLYFWLNTFQFIRSFNTNFFAIY